MIRARATSTASPDALWSVVSDVAAWPDLLPTFDGVTRERGSGAVGVGDRFAVRQPRLPAASYVVTEWSAGRSFTWESRSPGVVAIAVHRVSEQGSGSRLDLGLEWRGPLAPLVRLALGRRAGRMVDLEAATLARAAEQR